MSFPAYSEYKDSGVPWLGVVPLHWRTERLKTLFDLQKRAVRTEDEIVTAFRDGTVTLRKNRREEGFTNALQEIGYQGIRRGDLVIHAMDGFAGAIGVSDADGKSTPVYSVCRPRAGTSAHYYGRLLRHMALSGFVNALARGVRERSTEFRWSDASVLHLPVPPMDEQIAINVFLDRETAKIDALVAEQERLIALLKEKRQAVISHAVTKGLNPHAPMKDSGIEWLGEIPAHWEVKRLRHLASLNPSKSEIAELDLETEVSFLPMEAIGEDGQLSLDRTRPITDVITGYTYFREGDVTIAKITPCFENGKGAIMQGLIYGVGFGTTELIVVRADRSQSSAEFLNWLFRSYQFRALGEGAMYGAGGQKRVPDEFVRDFAIGLPPHIEQAEIVMHLNSITLEFDRLASEAQVTITLLQERRAALISAAVTGKIDVRGLVDKHELEAA